LVALAQENAHDETHAGGCIRAKKTMGGAHLPPPAEVNELPLDENSELNDASELYENSVPAVPLVRGRPS
jgi:hypothetical protein